MRWHLLIYIQFIFYLKRSRGKSEFSKLGGEPLTFRLLFGMLARGNSEKSECSKLEAELMTS